MNKYEKWYANITKRGQEFRNLPYTEAHHIIPKSIGGSNNSENLTALTAREHFIAHWLLTKIYFGKERYQLLNALQGMRRENPNQERYHTKITARVYANLKEEWSKLSSEKFSGQGNGFYGKHHTAEVKKRISEANKGRVQPDHEKQKQIAAITGRKRAPFSDEWRANLGKNHKSKNGTYDCSIKEETKKKISDKLRGRKQTQEEKARRSASVKALCLKREKKLCPHCNLMIAVNGYARWHGDNCKMKGN